jgi:DNA-binding SARP family transcriptional activator
MRGSMPNDRLVGHERLEPLRNARLKLLVLVAPAGYGKTATAAALASERPETIVLDDADRNAALADELRRRSTGTANPLTIVCSRKPLLVPLALALPHETRLIRADELRFDDAMIAELFAPLGASDAQLDQLSAATLGWPVALLVTRNRAAESGLVTAIRELGALADRPLEQYVLGALSSISDDARSLLLLAACEPLTAADADLLLGERCETALDEVEGSFLVRQQREGTYLLHPLLKAAIERRLQPAARAAAVSLANAFDRAQRPLQAARWYLRAGDSAAANAAYNQQTFARMTAITTDDSVAAAALDDASLIDNLAIFNIAAIEQLYTRDHDRWFAMAEEALDRAPVALPVDVRALAITMLVSRYAYFGRFTDAWRILDAQAALVGKSAEYQPTLAMCEAFIRVMHEEFVDLADLRRRVSPLLLDPYGRATFAAFANYAYAVQGDWTTQRTELEIMAETLERSKQEAHAVEVLMTCVFFAWLNGDDERFRNYLERLERLRAASGTSFFIRCVRGNGASATEEYETPQVRAYAYLIAAALEDEMGKARWFARRALREAERTGRPFFCVLAHLALALLGAGDASAHMANARALAESISPALRRAAAAVADGAEDAGMLTEYRKRFVRERRGEGFLCVNLLTATIDWEGRVLPLKTRPHQVIFALALAGRPLRSEELASRIWPDRDPARMQNALRVHIAAVRKASDPSVILFEDGRYHLTKAHVVDVDGAEALVRQAARSLPLGPSIRRTLEELAAGVDRRSRAWDDLDWFASIGRRTDALRRAALVTLAEDALHRQDSSAALRFVNLLFERDSCDERARSIAIRAHLQAGHETEAIREYREYRRAVRDELGVDLAPDPESDEALRAFVGAIRT